MSHPIGACTERHARKRFVLEEHRSRVNFDNPGELEVDQVRVDGCAIPEGIRCDYLVNVEATDASYFVELKGSDVEHAIDQLTRSQLLLKAHARKQITWIVSSSRCPLTSTEIQNHALRIRARHRATLKVRNSPVDVTL